MADEYTHSVQCGVSTCQMRCILDHICVNDTQNNIHTSRTCNDDMAAVAAAVVPAAATTDL